MINVVCFKMSVPNGLMELLVYITETYIYSAEREDPTLLPLLCLWQKELCGRGQRMPWDEDQLLQLQQLLDVLKNIRIEGEFKSKLVKVNVVLESSRSQVKMLVRGI